MQFKTNIDIDGSVTATGAKMTSLSSGTQTNAVMVKSDGTFEKRQLGTAGFADISGTLAASAAMQSITTTAGRNYDIQNMASGNLMVNVPWTDTTYTKSDFDLDHLFTLIGASADTDENMGAYTLSTITDNQTLKNNLISLQQKKENFILACSDETSTLTTGTKISFRLPYGFRLTDVRASVNTAPAGSTLDVDINYAGTSIFANGEEEGNLLTIDPNEATSTTANTDYTFADASSGGAVQYIDMQDDAKIEIDIDQIGSTTAGTGLKVTLIGYQL